MAHSFTCDRCHRPIPLTQKVYAVRLSLTMRENGSLPADTRLKADICGTCKTEMLGRWLADMEAPFSLDVPLLELPHSAEATALRMGV